MRIEDAFSMARDALSQLENGEQEAQWLVESINSDGNLSHSAIRKLKCQLQRRRNGISLFRIIGKKEFYNITIHISDLVFEPRWDTEVLLDMALDLCLPDVKSVLDLGTGTGCILLATWKVFPDAHIGIGVDLDVNALNLARKNARLLGIERLVFVQSDWGSSVGGKFDLIFSNPPYIPSYQVEQVAKDCGDQHLALDGGKDGMCHYHTIIGNASRLLSKKGVCILEHGYDQQNLVKGLIANYPNLQLIDTRKDLSGNPRAVAFSVAH